VELKGYFLSDSYDELKRYVFPEGVALRPWSRLALDRKVLGDGFRLSGKGIEVALTAPAGDFVVDAFHIQDLEDRCSSGRFPDGAESFRRSARPTPGLANIVPPVPDLLFSEIQYHPVTEDEADEYVEIHNRSNVRVALDGFRIRGGIKMDFPLGAAIGPGGYVVAAKDPPRICSKYGTPRAAVFGPFSGTLADSGERLALQDPGGNLVDEVEYMDGAPWPSWTDGGGASIELAAASAGNDLPGAWARARAAATPLDHFHLRRRPQKVQNKNLSEFQFLLLDPASASSTTFSSSHPRSAWSPKVSRGARRAGTRWGRTTPRTSTLTLTIRSGVATASSPREAGTRVTTSCPSRSLRRWRRTGSTT